MMLKIKEFDIRLIYERAFEYSFYYIEFNGENFLDMQLLRFKSDTILIEVEKELIDSLNKEVIWLIIQMYNNLIYFIRFKNIKLAMDFYTCIFLGEIKDGHIELNENIKRFLLKKFKVKKFDSFTENLVHIKFLVKYSPILSKFINFEEFNNIEIRKKDYKSINWEEVYYIEFNNGLKFFNTEEIDFYTKTLYAYIDPKFSQILKSFEK